MRLVFRLILAAVIAGVILWLVDACEVKEPFRRVIRVIVFIVAAVFVINVLLGLMGEPPMW